jgi:hypothetical protein
MSGHFVSDKAETGGGYFTCLAFFSDKAKTGASISYIWPLFFGQSQKGGHLFHISGFFSDRAKTEASISHVWPLFSDRAKKEASISITLFRTKPKKMIADPNLPPLPIACWFHSWPIDPLGRSSSISSVPFLLVILMMANYIIPEPLT